VLIDTHCHLDATEFDADRADVMARARAAAVGCIIVPSVERANFGAVSSLCREYPECRAAYGIHPIYVGRAEEGDLVALRDAVMRERPVAVGEIGLDQFVDDRDDLRQEFFFVEQLKLAREFDLPVLLHVRRAVDPVLKQLRRIRVVGGIAHAFNGSRQQAEEFIKLGFKLGFGGAMTYAKALRIRALAADLPLDAIVLETDAPDIPPVWLAGSRNEPAEMKKILEVFAGLRNLTTAVAAAAVEQNVRDLFPSLR
jgi:TatD DNase family protein